MGQGFLGVPEDIDSTAPLKLPDVQRWPPCPSIQRAGTAAVLEDAADSTHRSIGTLVRFSPHSSLLVAKPITTGWIFKTAWSTDQNVSLNKQERINLRALSWEIRINTLAKTLVMGHICCWVAFGNLEKQRPTLSRLGMPRLTWLMVDEGKNSA